MMNFAKALPWILALFLLSCASKQEQPPAPMPAPAPSATAMPQTLQEAVDSSYRTDANRERDKYRHPVQTLDFFGLQPNMTVIEVLPSSGWYLEILAPYLHDKGQYIGAAPYDGSNPKHGEALAKWLSSHEPVTDKVQFVAFDPTSSTELGTPNSADMVLTFRNFHNWMGKGAEKAALISFFRALKPGGTLGIVEHRASTKKKQDPKAKSGYVREDYIIHLAEKVGFKLVAKSEINANPKDTKDYPEGVWTLPPTYRLGEKNHAKYEAIGESDRMTLKFVKPAAN